MKKYKKVIIGIALLCLIYCYCIVNNPGRHINLKIGIFAGSNFGVYNGNSYEVIDKAIDLFEKENPNITIEYESGIVKSDYSSWLSKKLLKGEQLDAFMVLNDDFNTLSSIGALENLNHYIKRTNMFYDGIIESCNYQGNLFALPYEANPTMMCINKDLLEKEGINIPKDTWTIKEFYEICKQVTKDTNNDGIIDQYGSYNYGWLDALNAYGLDLFDQDGRKCNLNEPQEKESLNYIQKLTELNKGYNVSSEDFDQGKVAFCPLTIAQYRTYQPYPYRVSKYSKFSWSCLAMPGTKENSKTATCQTSLIAVNAKSSYKQIAYKFIEMFAANENIQLEIIQNSQGVSVLKSVMDSEQVNKILKLEDSNVLMPQTLNTILTNIKGQPKFKNYNRALEKADYLIKESINNQRIDIDLFSIKEQLDNELK